MRSAALIIGWLVSFYLLLVVGWILSKIFPESKKTQE